MRKVIDAQLKFGMIDISQIKFDIKSRDDIPQILKGLQYIYTQEDVRKKIFKILEEKVSPSADKTNGRPGVSRQLSLHDRIDSLEILLFTKCCLI